MVVLFVGGMFGWLQLEGGMGDVEVIAEAFAEVVEQLPGASGAEHLGCGDDVRAEDG
jgi:hypothetical protein